MASSPSSTFHPWVGILLPYHLMEFPSTPLPPARPINSDSSRLMRKASCHFCRMRDSQEFEISTETRNQQHEDSQVKTSTSGGLKLMQKGREACSLTAFVNPLMGLLVCRGGSRRDGLPAGNFVTEKNSISKTAV